MDFFAFSQSSLNSAPWLPSTPWSAFYLHAAWAIVLAVLLLGLLRAGLPRRLAVLEWLLPAGVLFWSLVTVLLPAAEAFSPAYWLGLAFQAPSLTSTGLAFWLGLRLLLLPRKMPMPHATSTQFAMLCGVVLGWLLMLDTFAVLPFGLYGLGFGTAALALVGLFWVVFLTIFGKDRRAQAISLLMLGVLLCFVGLRLPTGNLWDALIDPWLWLALHLKVLQGWRVSKAIRA